MAKKRQKQRKFKKARKPVKKLLKARKRTKVLVKKKAAKKVKVRRAKKRKPVRKIVKKIAPPKEEKSAFPAQSFFKAKIKVIGVGGGGGSIVSEIGRSLHKATFVVADTDVRAFKKRRGIKYFLFGQELTHGLGTGLNPDLARQAAEREKDNISKLFKDQDIIIFIASLGGGMGSGATKVFAEATKNFDGITFGIFTLPFKFEGKNKYKIAQKALRDLQKNLHVSVTIPNERIFKVIDANTPITQAFSLVNKSLVESLESLIDLIYSPGVINIDFADLRAILRGRGNLAFLNTAQASGSGLAEKITQDILNNPLYQSNHFNPEKVLFNIEGGKNLSMFEVDAISRAIAQTNPRAKIIFGISKNPKFKNKIKATLLMTGPPLGGYPEDKIKEVVPILKPVIKKPVRKAVVPKKKEITPEPPLIPFSSLALESQPAEESKKAIRRSALEIKKAEEADERKKSDQEKEWEIPAFLRFKK